MMSRRCTMMSVLLFSSGCKLQEAAKESETRTSQNSPALAAISDEKLLSLPTNISFLGRAEFGKPNTNFLPPKLLEDYRTRLKEAAAGRADSSYKFLKCEARMLPETLEQKECTFLLNKTDGAEFEFYFMTYNGQKECLLTTPGCAIHQAIRVKGWNNGLQRPAVFVHKTPLPAMSTLLFRPRVDQEEVLPPLLITGKPFPLDLGRTIAREVGLEDVTFQNAIQLSDLWVKNNRAFDLAQARAKAIATIIVGLSFNGILDGIEAFGANATATTWSKIMTLVNFSTSLTGLATSMVTVLGVRENVDALPPGSKARATAQTALLIVERASWANIYNLGGAALNGSVKSLLRFRVLKRGADALGKKLTALTKVEVDTIVRETDKSIASLTDHLGKEAPGVTAARVAAIVNEGAESILTKESTDEKSKTHPEIRKEIRTALTQRQVRCPGVKDRLCPDVIEKVLSVLKESHHEARLESARFHSSIVIPESGSAAPLYVNSSFRQSLNASALAQAPALFVGTKTELDQLVKSLQSQIDHTLGMP